MSRDEKRLAVAPNPCSTCPYLRSTPPGVWDASEYLKLAQYDAEPCLLPAFNCHQAENTLCRGWLSVHRESVPVRLLMLRKLVDPKDVPEEAEPGLYETGKEACAAGLKGVAKPSRKAKAAIKKLLAQRRRRSP